MDARGFGGRIEKLEGRKRYLTGAGTIAGLILLLAGLLVRSYGLGPPVSGFLLMALGGILVVLSLRQQSQRYHRSYYRHWIWRRRDTYVATLLILSFVAIFFLDLVQPQALFYYPYPPFSLMPDFYPAVGLLLICMIAPALLIPAAPARVDTGRKAVSPLSRVTDA